jgi:carbamoyltransferase
MTTTLGIHIGHDGGAAVCRDGEIIVACSEERLTRKKYANGWWLSVKYCLDATGNRLADFDAIIFSNSGDPLPFGFDGGLQAWTNEPLHILTVDHHTSHAIGAFCFSPFEKALVYVGDAGGNFSSTESAFAFDLSGWEQVLRSNHRRNRAAGLGTTYEAFTNFLGFSDQESGKTMALAAYGDSRFLNDIALFEVNTSGEVSSYLENSHYWGVNQFSEKIGGVLGNPFPDSSCELAQNIAAFIQKSFEVALEEAVCKLLATHSTDHLVLSGGIGLNCVANQRLSRAIGSQNFYAFPVCSDSGLPIGNAFYGFWQVERQLPKPTNKSFRFGRPYDEEEITRALERHPDTVPPGTMRHGDISWSRSSNRNACALELIEDGKIIGWWQGRSETGPRALGGRSILGDPSFQGMTEILNSKVKRREWFRPLAPSILCDYVLNITEDGSSSAYMNMAPKVISNAHHLIPECIHVDGSARIQSVEKHLAPELYSLLTEKVRKNCFPAVLNTSFNVREPITETPGDAIATFLRSNLDALILEDYIVTRIFPR